MTYARLASARAAASGVRRPIAVSGRSSTPHDAWPRAPAAPPRRARRGDHHRERRVGQDARQPLRRVGRIQRDVGAAGLQIPSTPTTSSGVRSRHSAHPRLGPDAQARAGGGRAVRAPVQLAVGHGLPAVQAGRRPPERGAPTRRSSSWTRRVAGIRAPCGSTPPAPARAPPPRAGPAARAARPRPRRPAPAPAPGGRASARPCRARTGRCCSSARRAGPGGRRERQGEIELGDLHAPLRLRSPSAPEARLPRPRRSAARTSPGRAASGSGCAPAAARPPASRTAPPGARTRPASPRAPAAAPRGSPGRPRDRSAAPAC